MTTLIADLSPIMYSNLFSVTSELIRNGAKEVNGKIPYTQEYENMVIFKILEEIAQLKPKFGVQEIVLASDNSKGGYWRKDFWSGYKFKRASERAESNIDWEKAFVTFEKIKDTIQDNTSFKLIDIPRVEGDDVAFVLSEYLSAQGTKVILHSLDHDWVYNLRHTGVSYYRTRKAQRKDGEFVDLTPGEILEMEMDHLIGGDPGDYIKNVKAYSKFSPEFKTQYPNRTEIEVWEKRHELDCMFTEKFGVSAYKHPRYGYKMFLKSKHSVVSLLAENEIYKKNYEINKKVAMPEGIPLEIKEQITTQYENAPCVRVNKELQKFFMTHGLFELNSNILFY